MPANKGWHIGQVKAKRESMCPPVMIWYDFKSRHIRPAEMSIQPAQTGAAMQGAPSQWQVVGSNDVNCDDDSNWTVLCEDLPTRNGAASTKSDIAECLKTNKNSVASASASSTI